MKTLKNIAVNALLVILSLIVGLFLIELGSRLLHLHRFRAETFVQPHRELGWSHVPNKEGYYTVEGNPVYVKINSKGLRDREYDYEKKAGTFRILILGDSFTEAFQVPLEDTFPKLLEERLNETAGHFEVINAGFGGVGTDYELLFFEREGRKYSPDLVLLTFFANDVYDSYRSRKILQDKGAPVEYERRGLIFCIRQFLAQHSNAYNYFGLVLPKHLPFLANILMKLGLLAEQPIKDAEGVTQLHWMVFAEQENPQWQEAWAVTKALILRLRDQCAAAGSKLAVVSIPFKEQVYENMWKRVSSEAGMAGRKWDLTKPDRILSEFLADQGIPFLPLLASFREASSRIQLYFSRDGHWNPEGHKLAEELIYKWVKAEALTPANDGR